MVGSSNIVDLQVAVQKFHNFTASVCRDTYRSEIELNAPPRRRWARVLLIAAVAALLVAATMVMATRIPKLQTERITFASQHKEVAKLQDRLADSIQKNESINCPCRNQVESWCHITTFHIYKATRNASQPFQDALNITSDQGAAYLVTMCTNPAKRNEQYENICISALSPVVDSMDSRTHLSTGSAYVSPDLLYTEITTRIDTNEFDQASSYQYLKDINESRLYNYGVGLAQLLRDMATQFQNSSVSSAEEFWNASQGTRTKFGDVLQLGFGMEVNWTAYLQNCDPAFCDVQYDVSPLNRVLRALAQVGGVTTMVSLALKFFLWPVLRTALNFSAMPPASLASSLP